MAKKKNKKSNRNDARGFNTGGTTTTSSNNTTTSSISSTSNHNKMKSSLVKIKSNQASTSKIIQSSSSYHQQKKKETLDLVGKSTRSIQVTSEAYNELMMLLDDIKQSIYEEKNDDDGDDDDDDDANSWMKSMIAPLLHDISMENKRLVKKVTSLNDNLEQLGFNQEQIQKVLVALISGRGLQSSYQYLLHLNTAKNETNNINILSLEAALDWLCLYLPSNELPRLFTDINHRRQDDNYNDDRLKNNISIIKAMEDFDVNHHNDDTQTLTTKPTHTTIASSSPVPVLLPQHGITSNMKENPNENHVYDDSTNNNPHYFIQKNKSSNQGHNVNIKSNDDANIQNVDDEAAAAAAKRDWLLSQYQYEAYEDEEEEEDEGYNNCDQQTYGGVNVQPQTQHAQNQKLVQGTGQEQAVPLVIKEEEEKRELFPEEVRLHRLEGEIQELKEDVNNEANNYMRSKQEIKEMKGNLRKMENQAKGLRGKIAKKLAKWTSGKKDETTTSLERDKEKSEEDEAVGCVAGLFDMPQDGIQDNEALVKKIHYIDVDIPRDWTGKTPKVMLIEHCRKLKWRKPTFNKMENTTNGCILTVKRMQHQEPCTIITEEGPFRSIQDAEHYVSTRALYNLNQELQLHLLMPPSFRALWTSWLQEEHNKQQEALMEKQNERRDKIAVLIAYIAYAVKCELDGDTNSSGGKNLLPIDEKEVIDNWDDDSQESSRSNLNEIEVFNPSSQLQLPSNFGDKMRNAFIRKMRGRRYEQMYSNRKCLPIFDFRQEILDTVNNNPVTILCAETGAGKTTQCPQYILEDALLSGFGDKTNIICTQPRRISALSVAERVADEMDDIVGKQVGYHIRMEAKKSKQTKLLFCTTGVILRRLQDDPNLNGITHVIVDEVHERQWEIDFLLIALRTLLNTTRRADLKVVLMSATLDSKLFCSFFQGAPFLSVPGRTYPVAEYYLEDLLDGTDHFIEHDSKYAFREDNNESTASLHITGRGGEKRKEIVTYEDYNNDLNDISDAYEGYKLSTRRSMERVNEKIINYDLIEDVLLLLIDSENNNQLVPPEGSELLLSKSDLSNGSILVFLPGLGEIRSLYDRLMGSPKFGDSNRFDVIPMHSSLSPKEQKRAFMKPKHGCQKIILATNIAETSITIDDCVCVLDSGLMREVVQDKRSSTSKLVTAWCSQASCKQRAGRAGRVKPGVCCKLYSSNTARSMKKQSIPELQKMPLEQVCLTILAGNLATDSMSFLSQAPQPPSNESVTLALKVLEETNAIEPIPNTRDLTTIRIEQITPLGKHLAKLPVDIRLGKMLIFGALFQTLDKTLTIAASLSSKSPFSTNIDQAQQASAAHKAFLHPTSDFLTVCNVWDAYRDACSSSISNGRKFCGRNYLNRSAFIEIQDARNQFIQLLIQIGFINPSRLTAKNSVLNSCYDTNGSNEKILSAIVCAGLYPNCAHIISTHPDELPTLWQQNNQLWFHKSSVFCKRKKIEESEWVIFHEKFATHKVLVSTSCLVNPFSLLLFGKTIDIKHLSRKVEVDGWIELNIPAQTSVIFKELRIAMSKELNRKITYVDSYQENDVLLSRITKLLSC